MKLKFIFMLSLCLLLPGCAQPYEIESEFTGVVKQINEAHQLLIVADSSETTYDIPVSDIRPYQVGQKLNITVFSNTDEDVWDLNHLKFEIETLE